MQSIKTTGYFVLWGGSLGAFLGVLSGTLIFPILGSGYALAWGAGMGLALGFLSGLLVALADAQPGWQMQRVAYRRRLSIGIGLLTAIGVAILLIATTEGFLWSAASLQPTPEGYMTSGMSVFLVASLVAGLFWGALAAAYTTAVHVDRATSATDDAEGSRIDSWRVIPRLISLALNGWTVLAGAVVGAVYQMTNVYSFEAMNGYGYPSSLLTHLLTG
ncbi:MAG: hypothetical protein MUE40_15560, partial [Anaerolineae bacterium]|nr:hypothetical protein [Anaerolineae bacterium]